LSFHGLFILVSVNRQSTIPDDIFDEVRSKPKGVMQPEEIVAIDRAYETLRDDYPSTRLWLGAKIIP
jgi:hypothetical protein